MKATDAYAALRSLGRDVITNKEAAALWGAGQRTTRRRLQSLGEAGLVTHIRHGLWSLDPEIDPFKVPSYLTAPLPAYVSFWSALHRHGLIEQIPRQVWVASLSRAKRVSTTAGTFEIHHIAPELFLGFTGSQESGYMAVPEKALFDAVYVRAAAGERSSFPEIALPKGFNRQLLKGWVERIGSQRLRTIVSRRLRDVLKQAA
jgi:predicted transcriptional regulator of viral defense system